MTGLLTIAMTSLVPRIDRIVTKTTVSQLPIDVPGQRCGVGQLDEMVVRGLFMSRNMEDLWTPSHFPSPSITVKTVVGTGSLKRRIALLLLGYLAAVMMGTNSGGGCDVMLLSFVLALSSLPMKVRRSAKVSKRSR